MTINSRTECLQSLFAYLQSKNIYYCVVGDTSEIPFAIPSDIDIVINHFHFNFIKDTIISFAKERHVQFIQLLQHEQTSLYFVLTWINDTSHIVYLHPDICSDYFRNGKLFLTADELLNGRRMAVTENGTKKGFFVPNPEMEFIYYLIKKIDKGDISKDQFGHLQDQFKQCPRQCLTKMYQFWPQKEAKNVSTWIQEDNLTALQIAIPRMRQMLAKKCRPTVKERWREFLRKISRVLYPTGLVVAFLGPDGCGKSTIGEQLKEELAPAFRKISHFHLRPNLLEGRKSSENGPVTNPHDQDPRGCIVSIAKLLYFLLDYTGGFWKKTRPLKVRSHLVMFDRYFHDILIDPVRYRYGAPMWAARLISWLIPKPDLFLVLDAPAETIQKRKQEVSLAETKRQRKSYLAFAHREKNCIVVNTDQPIEEAVSIARKAIFNYMEKRLQKRMGTI